MRPPEIAVAEAPGEVAKTISTEASQPAGASEPEKIKAETVEATTTGTATTEAAKPGVEMQDSTASGTDEAPASVVAPSQAAAEAVEQATSPLTSQARWRWLRKQKRIRIQVQKLGVRNPWRRTLNRNREINWHQIRTAPAGTAADGNVVEAAKQAEGMAAEPPKAMAAVAAEGSSKRCA